MKFDFKLPKKVKAKWVKALRSGKYKQTKGALKDKDGYCCLGVARAEGLTRRHSDGSAFVRKTFLPLEIQEFLSDMNDDLNDKLWSFKKIANWIERNL